MEAHALDPRDLLDHADGMRRVALRLLRDEADADDVVQEALVRAVQSPPRDGMPLRPWLAVVTRNLAIDLIRSGSRRRHREQAQRERDLAWPTPDQLVERTEAHRRAVDTLLGLPEPYRETLILRFLHDQSAAEIARHRDVPEATVRSQVKRGLDMLRRELGAEEGRNWRASCLLLLQPLSRMSPPSAAPPLLLGGLLAVVLTGWIQLTAPAPGSRGPSIEQSRAAAELNQSLRELGYVDDTLDSLDSLGYIGDVGDD